MKNLKIKTKCPRPFDTLSIDKNGSCFACVCAAWLPVPVGNLHVTSLQEIFDGEKINDIRTSIKDGSYSNCNEQLCSYLQDVRPKKNSQWPLTAPSPLLKNIRLGIDNSCNLSCPSCRTNKIFHKKGIKLSSGIKLADKILNYIQQTNDNILVHVGSDGDPFASLVYRYFIRNCPKKKNISFSLQTNGLLIEKMYKKNKWLFQQTKKIGVSVDGCTAESYESLRRGGKFSVLLSNLSFLKDLKMKYKFRLEFHCVVQKGNVHQLNDYAHFAMDYNADEIFFNRITDWKTLKNFADHDVCVSTHPLYRVVCEQVSKLSKIPKHKSGHHRVSFPTIKISN